MRTRLCGLRGVVYSDCVAASEAGSLVLRASVRAILVTLGLWALGLAAVFLLALSQIGLTFALVVCAFLLLFPGINFLSWWMFRFVIDDDKVQVVRTLIFRSRATLEFNKIEGVDTQQGPFGRALDYGRLTISGVGRKQLRTEAIDHPDDLARRIRDLIPRQ